ncbi:MAG: DUF721 domain-containing protein [Deltaproteobacteria bacterium]|nr:MAG: DUF721 domain-containing protein [Deltaproteobacteria bacterium]
MRRDRRGIDFNLKAALKGALRSLNLDARMRGYAIWGIWDKVVGETVAQQAQPSFLRRGILFIKCSSPAWMQQLQFMKGMILEELNRQLGGEVIKDIRFQIGVVSRPSLEGQSVGDQDVVLDEAEKEWMTEALRPLQDPEVKEIVRRIMVKESSLKKK